MKRLIIPGILCLFFLFACEHSSKETSSSEAYPKEISFYTSDSIKIFGDLYISDQSDPVILLFHQGGSNARAEYGPIIPRLLEDDFNILAIDQRQGGQYFGGYNRTIANVPTYNYSDTYTYCDAYNNLESALDFVIENDFTGKKILWGSSYSATLSIKLAHERQQAVDAVLAFSPASGKPMEGCNPEPFLENLTVPLLFLRPRRELQSERSQNQLDLVKSYNHQTYIAENGVHGSSMLVETRTKHPVNEVWQVVMEFIRTNVDS